MQEGVRLGVTHRWGGLGSWNKEVEVDVVVLELGF